MFCVVSGCKSNTFCINSHYSAYFLIVKNLTNLHFVKFVNNSAFILITFCTQNLSFRYKSSKPTKKVPLFLAVRKRGRVPGKD